MTYLVYRISFILILLSCSIHAEPLKAKVEAESAILINADTGAILYEKDAHRPLYPASVTKIATAIYTLNRGGVNLDTILTVEAEDVAAVSEQDKRKANYTQPSYWLVFDATHIGLKKGEQMTLRDLLYGLMVASGDDAANVIARYIGGTIPQFMDDVNAYLKELGLKETHLNNPHGLHHPEHITTAYDMALLTREALKNPTFREIVSTVRYTRPKTNMQEPTPLVQGNRLIRKGTPQYYPKAIGVKTGYTSAANTTFVAAAQDNNRTLIAALFKTKERNNAFKDAAALFEQAFQQPKQEKTVLTAGKQKFARQIKGARKPIETYLAADVKLNYFPAEDPKVNALLYWDDVSLPIAKGQKVGEIRLTSLDGRAIQNIPLYALQDVKGSILYKATSAIAGLGVFGTLSLIVLCGGIFVFMSKRLSRIRR